MNLNNKRTYHFYKTKDNSLTLFNEYYNDFYHSKKGALKESLYQFIYPIKNFLKNFNNFCFFEIGFGLGYNALVTNYFLKKLNKNFQYFSIEKDKELIEFLFKNCKKFKIKNYCKFLNEIKNKVIFQDAIDFDFSELRNLKKDFLIIFHDAFSPSKNKELWSFSFFKKLKESNFDFLVTFTSNPKVRVSLFLNDYFVLPTFRIGKGTGTLALKNLKYLNYLNFKNYTMKELILLFSNYAIPYETKIKGKKFPFKVKNKKIKIIDENFYKELIEIKDLNIESSQKFLKGKIQEFWMDKLNL